MRNRKLVRPQGQLRQERAVLGLQVGVQQGQGFALELAVAVAGARQEADAIGLGLFQRLRDQVADLSVAFGRQSLVPLRALSGKGAAGHEDTA